jgi:hypothetical protein
MSKHTPGPWVWRGPNMLCGGERKSEDILRSADDGKPYGMHSAIIEHHWNDDVAKANANLIAVAPELLEALKLCLPYARAALDAAGGINEYNATYAAEVAIAKAEGSA